MKPGVGSTIDFEHPLARGLVGCWLFNEGGGSRIFDLAKAANGQLVSASRTQTGLAFDGGEKYVSLPHQRAFDGNAFTFSIWARPSELTDSRWVANNWVSPDGFALFKFTGDHLVFEMGQYSESIEVWGYFTAVNKWHHIVVTRNGSTLAVYRDGILLASGTKVIRTLLTGNFFISSPSTGGVSPWKGGLDNAALYDRALSPSEVRALFANPYAFIDSSEDDLGFVLGGLNLTLVVSDSFGLADAPSKSDAKSISDSVNVLDARKLAFLKSVADNFTLSDNSNRVLVIVLQLADAFSLSSSEKRAVTKTVMELLALNDLSMKLAGKPFADSFGTGDAFTKRFTKGLQELFTLNDLMVKSTGKNLLDTLTLADLVGIVGGSGRPGLIHGMLSVDWEPRLMSLEWEGRNLTVHWTN